MDGSYCARALVTGYQVRARRPVHAGGRVSHKWPGALIEMTKGLGANIAGQQSGGQRIEFAVHLKHCFKLQAANRSADNRAKRFTGTARHFLLTSTGEWRPCGSQPRACFTLTSPAAVQENMLCTVNSDYGVCPERPALATDTCVSVDASLI